MNPHGHDTISLGTELPKCVKQFANVASDVLEQELVQNKSCSRQPVAIATLEKTKAHLSGHY